MKNQNKDIGQASEILVRGTQQRIDAVLLARPYEAMSLAKDLMSQYPNDYGVLAMCVRTALQGESVSGKMMLTSDVNEAIQKAAKDRMFNPELSALAFASKISIGGKPDGEDMTALTRAFKMDPRITKKTMVLVKDKTKGLSIGGLGECISEK